MLRVEDCEEWPGEDENEDEDDFFREYVDNANWELFISGLLRFIADLR
jgi:hypothetical protein